MPICFNNVLRFMSKKLYPGDITREQFAKIAPILELTRKRTRPRTLDLYYVFNAIQRWVVERSFAWLEKCHRLWKNCERKLSSSLAMVQLAFV